jgi:hypothetical protein
VVGVSQAALLDSIRRLRILADALPGTACEERELDVPYERASQFLRDIEHNLPVFDPFVWRVKVLTREGRKVRMRANFWPFVGDVSEGWTLMQAAGRLFAVGIALVPVDGGNRTRIAEFEGVPRRGWRWLRPLFRRTVRADLDGIERCLTRAGPGRPG